MNEGESDLMFASTRVPSEFIGLIFATISLYQQASQSIGALEVMKRKTITRRPRKSTKARVPWTSKDLAALKKLNREGQHARDIGKQLGRSEGAIRQYAYSKGAALRAKRA